jgi:hypothetical protein
LAVVDNAPSEVSPLPAISNFTSSRPAATSHCRHTNTEHVSRITAIMSDNENNDSGEEMVTKPFKFVTGKLSRASAICEDDKLTSMPQLVRRLLSLSSRLHRLYRKAAELSICATMY